MLAEDLHVQSRPGPAWSTELTLAQGEGWSFDMVQMERKCAGNSAQRERVHFWTIHLWYFSLYAAVKLADARTVHWGR